MRLRVHISLSLLFVFRSRLGAKSDELALKEERGIAWDRT